LKPAKLQEFRFLFHGHKDIFMPIITLTSDWGLKDHYLGAVKGVIISRMPEALIVDITHSVPPFNSEQAAFILKNAYPNYPKGTVHIIAVNTEESVKFPHTAVEYNGHYFIGTDNGVFSLICDKQPDKIVEIQVPQDSDCFTFSTRDRFAKVAIHLAQGGNMEELGKVKNKILEKSLLNPVIDSNNIKGHVMYIDSYENVITNITEPVFRQTCAGRKFSIFFRSYEIKKISRSYQDVPPGEILALFDSNRYLEIAINQNNAAGLLGLEYKDMVRVEFV
jgi:S-adenosyl-L-methionine hydrolase (adenosine-forming)